MFFKKMISSHVIQIICIVLILAFFVGLCSNLIFKPSRSSSGSGSPSNPGGTVVPPVIKYDYPDSSYFGNLYNSSFKGTRYAFDSSDVVIPEVSDASASTLSVVDGSLEYRALSRDKSYFTLAFPEVVEAESFESVIEFDLKLSAQVVNVNYNLATIELNSNNLTSKIFLKFNSSTGMFEIPRSDYSTFYEGEALNISPEEWNNLRFVYSVVDNASAVKLYLNNEFVARFTVQHKVTSETAESFVNIGFYNANVDDLICLDNVYCGYVLKSSE